GRDVARHLLRRGVQRDDCFVAARRRGDALLDVCGRVLRRQRAGREAHASRRWPGQAVDAKRAPVLATTIPGDEIPAAAMVDERMGLDLATAAGPIASSIAEAKALRVAAGGGDHGELLRVDSRSAYRQRGRRRAERPDATAQVQRKDLLQLDQRS